MKSSGTDRVGRSGGEELAFVVSGQGGQNLASVDMSTDRPLCQGIKHHIL